MNILKTISNFVARARTSSLVLICVMAGLTCAMALTTTGKYTGMFLQDFLISLMFFFWGFAGVPMVIRQEADFGLICFHGLLAIVLGVVIIICGFGLALIPVWILLFTPI